MCVVSLVAGGVADATQGQAKSSVYVNSVIPAACSPAPQLGAAVQSSATTSKRYRSPGFWANAIRMLSVSHTPAVSGESTKDTLYQSTSPTGHRLPTMPRCEEVASVR